MNPTHLFILLLSLCNLQQNNTDNHGQKTLTGNTSYDLVSLTRKNDKELTDQQVVSREDVPEPPDFDYVLKHITPTHPRLFLNKELLEKIKRDGLTLAQEVWLDTLRLRVIGYTEPPEIDNKLMTFMLSDEGGYSYAGSDSKSGARVYEGNWGYYAAHTALAYLLTGEKVFYDRALVFLKHITGIYKVINDNDRIAYGKAFGRLSALSAYDWLYNDLSKDQREEIGKPLFNALHSFYKHWRFHRPGNRDIYTDNLMGWPLGLVFWDEDIKGWPVTSQYTYKKDIKKEKDIKDELFWQAPAKGADNDFIKDLLSFEYDQWKTIFNQIAVKPDGLALYGAIGYSCQFISSEANFLDTWRSAIGGNFSDYFPQRANLPSYLLWNTINPTSNTALCYGWSDVYHIDNTLGQIHWPYLNRAPDLYADLGGDLDPNVLAAIAQIQTPVNYQHFIPDDPGSSWLTSASPLIMSTNVMSAEDIQSNLARLPRARNFPDPIGQIFMNSGWGKNDTYAMFIAGRQTRTRKHYDENHFTIYKKGFLGLDSGARGLSVGRGYFPEGHPKNIAIEHELNYYYETIAHNCVTIFMPGETKLAFWGPAGGAPNPPVPNTGGMDKNCGAQVKAFETNDYFTYIASDATSCYHQDKSQEVIRQFMFVYPDYFVVFDRVASKTTDQKKTWLMHTQNKPEVNGDIFRSEQEDGVMYVRTLLPKTLQSEKIGGPGKEYWTGDKNWPVNVEWQSLTPDQQLFGSYRMEISSTQENQKELFLHLIQVGDKKELKKMTSSKRVEIRMQVGVEFQTNDGTVQVLFNKEGDVGGNIRITRGKKVKVECPLTQQVMQQNGLALISPR